jgi:tetratricopeptide (TPR) repeat protein
MNTYLAEKQIDKAVASVNEQIVKSPGNSKFYELLGALLFHGKRDLLGAEAAFNKALALDQHNSDAVIQLCQVRAEKGEVDQAIASGEQSLKNDPRQVNLVLLMANLYASKGEWKKAEDDFQNVLALNSQNPAAAHGLARVMLRTGGSLDVALSLAQTALRGMPDSPAVVDTLGWIYYQKGVNALAISNLQEALRLQEKDKMPDDPNIHYHLGMAYEKGAQPALARQHFEHVLKNYPNYSGTAEIKRELTHLSS